MSSLATVKIYCFFINSSQDNGFSQQKLITEAPTEISVRKVYKIKLENDVVLLSLLANFCNILTFTVGFLKFSLLFLSIEKHEYNFSWLYACFDPQGLYLVFSINTKKIFICTSYRWFLPINLLVYCKT